MPPTANDDAKPTPDSFIQALARGLSMLEVFDEQHPDLSLTELALALNTNKPTARRIAQTLVTLGYLETLPAKRYRLGTRALALGQRYLATLDLAQVARPHLERLSQATGESTNLAVRDGREVVYVVRVQAAPRILSINLQVGSRLPAYATSLGKALLLGKTDAELVAVLGPPPWPALTPHTARSPVTLRPSLDHVQSHGYAICDGELELGLRSIAAPVFNAEAQVAAAVNVSTHAAQVPIEQLTGPFAQALLKTARDLSHALGYSGIPA